MDRQIGRGISKELLNKRDIAARQLWTRSVGSLAKPVTSDKVVEAAPQLSNRSVQVNSHNIPGFHHLKQSGPDIPRTISVATQSLSPPKISTHPSKVQNSPGKPENRFKNLTERELMYMRLGEKLCDLDPDLFPKLPTQKYAKNSGEEMLRNVSESVSIIKMALGSDSRNTFFANIASATSQICGVHQNTVFRRTPERVAPKRKLLRDMGKKEKCRRYASQIDLLRRVRIIERVHNLWKEKRDVTVDDLWQWAKQEIEFNRGRTIFLKVLRGIGFVYKSNDYNSQVMERGDIIHRRAVYLREKKEWDDKDALYGSFDETWGYSGMVKKKAWQHANTGMYKRARLMDLESSQAGPEKGRDKGKRVIIAAVITEFGILSGSEMFLISKSKAEEQQADFHSDMDAKKFEEYYQDMIPLFAAEARKHGRPAVLLCDNAPYHNAAIKKPPTTGSNRDEIIKFLTENNIKFYRGQTRPILYELSKAYVESNGGRAAFTTYKFDEFAKSYGVTVLRLPQYHCFFNPVEFLWAQLKHHLRKEGTTTDSVETVRDRAETFLKNFPSSSAKKLFDHTQKMEVDVREMTAEKELQYHDTAFNLIYDEDQEGQPYNIHAESDGENFDSENADYPSDCQIGSDDGSYYSEIDEMA